MRNIFLNCVSHSNSIATDNYDATVECGAPLEDVKCFLEDKTIELLTEHLPNGRIFAWGSEDGSKNRSCWSQMEPGDDFLIVYHGTIRCYAKILATCEHRALARRLWYSEDSIWPLIYFLTQPYDPKLPWPAMRDDLGYDAGFTVRGLTHVDDARAKRLYLNFGDVPRYLRQERPER